MSQSMLQKQVADPDEMIGSALLLTSDAGINITGQTLCADGGQIAH